MPAAIVVDDVSLVRRTQEELHYDFKRSALRLLGGQGRQVRRRTVLDHLSLRVEHGEKVGVIGPNGSGKSTLLKVIAGILQPTSGSVAVDGTLAPLIELGVGFDADLSLVDNIVYYGVLLGHPEEQVRAHIHSILEFAELVEHRDEPTKTLSSGMAARLSFAIATEFRPEVLLVDEVLSVGDERFRRKCTARIDRFWDEHSTILLVSHDMLTVAQICSRVIWLDHGGVRFDGPSKHAAEMYLSTIPTVANFRRGEDLVAFARTNPRREIIVQGTSGHPQIYLIRDGRRHAIVSSEWTVRHGYEGKDVVIVSDEVILEVAEGEMLAP
ncbi:MAG: ABC transporter ATP-binding protein [Candidatus Eremiobacteraeota bacterium]|nr:ABC transporter ATP-binding protein [Candidatus Eremiobacteraeota bacterium]